MISDHLRHIRHTVDGQSLTVRGAVALGALLTLPVFGTGVRELGSVFEIGNLVLPLLVLAHVPVVVAAIAVWSIGCDVCGLGEEEG